MAGVNGYLLMAFLLQFLVSAVISNALELGPFPIIDIQYLIGCLSWFVTVILITAVRLEISCSRVVTFILGGLSHSLGKTAIA
ncbi:MAG: hypothetical protein JST01_25180 [Cyanobacteria bacterium SZAS TMP-1]|nr:hypothetical protein [Cyanobacteria bacterium SZAS TMP-1]